MDTQQLKFNYLLTQFHFSFTLLDFVYRGCDILVVLSWIISLLTLAISVAAFSFYRDYIAQRARRCIMLAFCISLCLCMSSYFTVSLITNNVSNKEDNLIEPSFFLKTLVEDSENIKVMFGNKFYFLFSKICFWEYKNNNFLVFLK